MQSRGSRALRTVRTVGTPIAALAAVLLLSFSTNTACSSDPECVDSKCAANNKCIAFEGETKCQRLCTSNADPSASCPFNYACTQVDGLATPICVQSTGKLGDGRPIVKKDTGQWGALCKASQGVENPDCDLDQGFYCYGLSPTDGDAYCTRYACEKDRDCGAGFYCGKVNRTPNTGNAKRTTVGETEAVCLRRNYCAPCKVDLDCPPLKGVPQHCVLDAKAKGYCTPECTKTANCNNEAQCQDPGIGVTVCVPRAGACVGDGALCSPCLSDADCGTDGACIKGEYTTEKICAKKGPGECKVQDNRIVEIAGCEPTVQVGDRAANVSCIAATTSVLRNYCFGLYDFGEAADIGCWTPKK